MNKKRKTLKIEGILALLLFLVFALCIVSVLLTGADIYQGITERNCVNYDQRTAAQYIATKVRQSDTRGSICAEDFEGVSSLVMSEEIEGALYQTRIYCYEGYLRELFAAEKEEFHPRDGEKILALDKLEFSVEGAAVTARITETDGGTHEHILYLRSEGEGFR